MDGAVLDEALLSAIKTLFNKIRDVLNLIRRKKLEDGRLKQLKSLLMSITAVLDDAKNKEITNINLKNWLLTNLKDAVYDAEDFLDEIATENKLKSEDQTTFSQQVSCFFYCLNPSNRNMRSKLEEMLKRENGLVEQITSHRLEEGRVRELIQSPTATSLVDESGFFGRDDEKEAIMKLLHPEIPTQNQIDVISIVGMGGVGKTTLAQSIYNDKKVEEWFELKAWVCVSEEYDPIRVTKTILEDITSRCDNSQNPNQIQLKLKEKLSRKKFLLILDDVWNDRNGDWEDLKKPFNSVAKNSKIIVTTRFDRVAAIVRTVPTYHLNILSDEGCWEVFAKFAFVNLSTGLPPNLKRIGEDIVKRCKGLPLAAKALGGLLQGQQEVEWNKILNSHLWDKDDEILPALRLSYYHLPSHLKHCFAYCSLFPKDYEFTKEELIRLWMAEGLLACSNEDASLEERGDKYFKELTSRSFFQQKGADKSCFVMHDLINDLAKSICGETFCRLEGSVSSSELTKKTRHLSHVQDGYDDVSKKFGMLYEAKGLRTFLTLPSYRRSYATNKIMDDLVVNSRRLRVLSLAQYPNIKELPVEIHNSKHLRYLNLSKTSVERLPNSFTSLYNLQTLILFECENLVKLPKDMGRLINMRHLDIRGTKIEMMPVGMDRMKDLRLLTNFILGKGKWSRIDELGKLEHLGGRLAISNLQNVERATDAKEANLKDKKNLKELELIWSRNDGIDRDPQNDDKVLEELEPHKELEGLFIRFYEGTKFPEWAGSFSKVVSMDLRDCKNCNILPPLGQLQSLKSLSIIRFGGVKTVADDFHGRGDASIKPFVALEVLRFEGMPEWVEWFCSSDEAFCKLRELYLRDCPKLSKSFPRHLPSSLVKLEISGCRKLGGLLPTAPNSQLSLNYLEIEDCPNLISFSENRLFAPSLEHLSITFCSKIKGFPKEGLPKLKSLTIGWSEKLIEGLMKREWGLQSLPSLTALRTNGGEGIESFPDEHLLPSSLTSLQISYFPNLKCLDSKGFERLTALSQLEISFCPMLQSMPKKSVLSSLSNLRIISCPKLRENCEKEKGKDWPNISHIPRVEIDHELIS